MDKTDAARRLLHWPDTGVVQAAATLLALEQDSASMAMLCEALASDPELEVGETILWAIHEAWRFKGIDVPLLLEQVARTHQGAAAQGAAEAQEWLRVQ